MTEYILRLPNGVIVSEATIEDVPSIIELWKREYVPGPERFTRTTPEKAELIRVQLSEYIQDESNITRMRNKQQERIASDRSAIFVAKHDEQLVGYGAADIAADGSHENNGKYVDKIWQNRHIGTGLTVVSILWHNRHSWLGEPVPIYAYTIPRTSNIDVLGSWGFRWIGIKSVPQGRKGQYLWLSEMKLWPRDQNIALRKLAEVNR